AKGRNSQKAIKTALPQLHSGAVRVEVLQGVQRLAKVLTGLFSIRRRSGKVLQDRVLQVNQPLGSAGEIPFVKLELRVPLTGEAVCVGIGLHHLIDGLVDEFVRLAADGFRNSLEHSFGDLLVNSWLKSKCR